MEDVCKELPEECWALIASRLNHHRQLEPLSLVSKNFLAITNQLRVSLKVIHPTIKFFAKQLQRFPHVKRIDLSNFAGSLQEALLEMAQSGLNIEELNISSNSNPHIMLLKDLGTKMKNVKVFKCSNSYLTDTDLVVLADSFPLIEELDISKQHFQDITDKGVCGISLKLKHLRKINLTGNKKVSDQSIIALSSNCEFLTEIVLRYCDQVSQNGISFVMENSRSYNSLVLAANAFHPFEMTNPLNFSACLSTIDLYYMKISDEFLNAIARAEISLKNLHLSSCRNFTFGGLYPLLKAYPSLESLDLSEIDILTDESVIDMCQFIRKLISIKLNYCSKLTGSSFIAIASACPYIRNIEIASLSRGQISPDTASGLAKNPSITSAFLPSTGLKQLLYTCSNLQVLRVNCTSDSKELDIAYVLKCCHDLTHLTLINCQRLKLEETEQEISKLEWLSATNSGINDKVLEMVGKRCPKLVHLDLEQCMSVTVKGVREVAKHCRRLRYVNLDFCLSVKKDVVAWMVASCQSLRQIVTPGPTDHHKGEIEGFLRQGCLVIPGSWEEDFY